MAIEAPPQPKAAAPLRPAGRPLASPPRRFQKWDFVWLALVLVLSYSTYFRHYSTPADMYWDENYHIAAAQKYLHHIFFMELHPPLGKLLIALGEKLWHPNAVTDQFIGITRAPRAPPGFSFKGYRFFPALLGWLCAPLLFAVFWLLGASSRRAFLLSGLYVFDNALIVHNRGAMLDSCLLFLSLGMIALYLVIRKGRRHPQRLSWGSWGLGALFGLVMTTKLLGLIMGGLFLALAYDLWPDRRQIIRMAALAALGFGMTFVAVWQTHAWLAWQRNPDLPGKGFYTATADYRPLIDSGQNRRLAAFPVLIKNYLHFLPIFDSGTDRLNLGRPGENASPYFYWPFGARAINYLRFTPAKTDQWHKYLYLQCNPVIWFCGLVGLTLSFIFLAAPLLLEVPSKPKHLGLMALFFGLYGLYMAAIAQLDREMYLYHYFTPLLFSFLLFGLAVTDLERIGRFRVSERAKDWGLGTLMALMLGSYVFFSPLTYYRPLTNAQLKSRAWLRIWSLRYPNDPTRDPVAQPLPRLGVLYYGPDAMMASSKPR